MTFKSAALKQPVPTNLEKSQYVAANKIDEQKAIDFKVEVELIAYIMNNPLTIGEHRYKRYDFTTEQHYLIFITIYELICKAVDIDLMTVSNIIREKFKYYNEIEFLKSWKYIEISRNKNKEQIDDAVKRFNDARTRRKLIHLASVTNYIAIDDTVDAHTKVTKVATELKLIQDNITNSNPFTKYTDVFSEIIEHSEKFGDIGGMPIEMEWGIRDLDELTYGLNRQELVILAARPGMGKSSLALQVAMNAAKNVGCAYFSLEMSKRSLVSRVVSHYLKVDIKEINRGGLTKNQVAKLKEYQSSQAYLNLYFEDKAGLTIGELKSRVAILKQEKNIGMIVVDYLQLLSSDNKKTNRFEAVSEISRQLKNIAKEFDICVFALSQLSRSCEDREDKRPVNSDLRESGQIEQDADIIAFIYRDNVYNKQSNPTAAEIILRKSRNSECKTVYAKWMYKEFTFKDQPIGYDYESDLKSTFDPYEKSPFDVEEFSRELRTVDKEDERVVQVAQSTQSVDDDNPFDDVF